MILIILGLAVVIISALLALSSLSEFEDLPEENSAPFLIRNPQNLDLNDLKGSQVYSLERLFKGRDRALVIFGKKDLLGNISKLDLLELDDYSKGVEGKNSLAFELKKGKFEVKVLDLSNISLDDSEQIIIQTVFQPHNRNFQTSIRVIILAEEFQRRADIAKEVEGATRGSGLERVDKSSSKVLEAFKKRGLRPKEVKKMFLNWLEIKNLQA